MRIDMKNHNSTTIYGWMVNELGLSGNELICYAIIYGFSQDGASSFCGSRKYISKFIGAKSLNTVDKYLDILIEKGLILKTSNIHNGVISNYYKVNLKNSYFQNCTPPSNFEYPPSNFEHDNTIYIDSNKEERDKSLSKKERKDELFEQCWKEYRRKGSKAKAQTQWIKLKQDEKERILQHIKAYVSSRELQYQKDFERYIKDKIFDTLVIANSRVVYDPTLSDANEYRPTLSSQLLFHNELNCYLYIGFFSGFIGDGYDDNNRPNGAKVMLNNGRGIITWNKEQKQWILKK